MLGSGPPPLRVSATDDETDDRVLLRASRVRISQSFHRVLAHDLKRGRFMREQSIHGSSVDRDVLRIPRHVILVARDGVVLERALENRDWLVTHLETGRAFESWLDPDVVLLVLDDDELDVFETLIRLSVMPSRPPVVLLTRRADGRALGPNVLESLGVDRLLAWPARADKIEAELIDAAATKQSLRSVS